MMIVEVAQSEDIACGSDVAITPGFRDGFMDKRTDKTSIAGSSHGNRSIKKQFPTGKKELFV